MGASLRSGIAILLRSDQIIQALALQSHRVINLNFSAGAIIETHQTIATSPSTTTTKRGITFQTATFSASPSLTRSLRLRAKITT